MRNFEPGDYVKAEFRDDKSGQNEWMWVRVNSCDDQQRIVFGILDSEPLLDYGEKLTLGSEIAVSFDNIREHRKPGDFKVQ